jgi:hypothetical protein
MRKALLLSGLMFVATPLLAQAPAAPGQPPGPVPKPASLGVFVYAQKSQDAAQQDKDEVECYRWAQQQTGLDPMAPTPAATPQAAKGPDGSAVKGAARGAARGAVVGEAVDGDASDGAAVGAAAGAVRGRRKSKKQAAQAEKAAQQETKVQSQQGTDTFKKAWSACLDGRGYSVK